MEWIGERFKRKHLLFVNKLHLESKRKGAILSDTGKRKRKLQVLVQFSIFLNKSFKMCFCYMNLETLDTGFHIKNIFDSLNHEVKKPEKYLNMKANFTF